MAWPTWVHSPCRAMHASVGQSISDLEYGISRCALHERALLLQTRVRVYISYGGLLMLITGDLQKLQELEVDSNIYLLMRKV